MALRCWQRVDVADELRAAAYTARMGYHWLEFSDRPEHFFLLGLFVFAPPFI